MFIWIPSFTCRLSAAQGHHSRLRDVARGIIPWAVYEKEQTLAAGVIGGGLTTMLFAADILCTAPALSEQKKFREWKNEKAKGVAVDEAGNISRPDLFCV